MSVVDNIFSGLSSSGGSTINERVKNFLISEGLGTSSSSISDMLNKYTFDGKIGWQALIAKYGLGAVDELEALISTLFGNGEQGAFYVPQPQVLGQQVLYQDSAGTVPVTADGDPVGLMLDVSGNGNHASQATSGARPVYRTDGTLHWLEADGVDDYLLHDFSLTGTGMLMAAARSNLSAASIKGLFGATPPNGVQYAAIFSEANDVNWGSYGSNRFRPSSYSLQGATRVVASVADTTSSQILYTDKNAGEPLPYTPYGGDSNERRKLFQETNNTRSFYGLFYGALAVDRVPSDQEREDAIDYLASLAGVSL